MNKIIAHTIIILLFVWIICNPLVLHATYINKPTITISWDFVINNDLTKTSLSNVTLYNDMVGITEMRFWNTVATRDSAMWETYSPTKSWALSSWLWNKTVYASFRNSWWDIVNIEDEIILISPTTLPYTTWLTLWLDSNDVSSVVETWWVVSAWNDKSWNWYNALQDTASEQPTIVTDEIVFDGTSDYFYIENLNYVNTNTIDGLLVCSVFKTTNTSSSLSWNWSILDFDRSEWFNFYSLSDWVWFSYLWSWIQDISVTWVWINDNNLHVTCASYDNTITNETVVTVDGVVEYEADRVVTWTEIWVAQSTRFWFVWDWSEAATEDAGRNNAYFDWSIAEIVYFDSKVASTDRKDIECYLWEKWWVLVDWCVVPWANPIGTIEYSPEVNTSWVVVAQANNFSSSVTITNNGWSNAHSFSANGSFTFEYEDAFWNPWSSVATVDWIVDNWMPWTSTGWVNEPPIITSFTWAISAEVLVASGATSVGTITAIDHDYNVIGQFWKDLLSWNMWKTINHADMCSPVVVASHRWNVNWEIQRAPRISNKTALSFDIKVDNYNSTIWWISTDVDYIVFEAWSHEFNWMQVQADSVSVSNVICSWDYAWANWTTINFAPVFPLAPSVLHTIASFDDSTWVVSWVNDWISRDWEPTASFMWLTMQRSFNSCAHDPELFDYVAFEQWNFLQTEWFTVDSTRSGDTILSVTSGGNDISFDTPFTLTPEVVLVAQLWEDWWNGWYGQIHTGSWVLNDRVYATVDEDWPWADRAHTNEVFSSVAFSEDSWSFVEDNSLSYSVVWWTDASAFTLDPVAGALKFITWKDPANPTDTNWDWYYEIIVQACDSHCDSKCTSQTIIADVRDKLPPTVNSSSPTSNDILPWWNHNLVFNYTDDAIWVDPTSDVLRLFKWNGSSWWADISSGFITFGSKVVTTSSATYPLLNASLWKYKAELDIADINWNTSTYEVEFYIDIPKFNISEDIIEIWTINTSSNIFAPTVVLTVDTVWVPYKIYMNKWTVLTFSPNTLPFYDGTYWIWYNMLQDWSLGQIWTDELVVTEGANLNTNWNYNTETHLLDIWWIHNAGQAAWDYEWDVSFRIEYDY